MKWPMCKATAVAASVLALVGAQASHADSRIREETYDANRVYAIHAAAGCAALIELERGEVIDPTQNPGGGGLGMGDPKAWNMSVTGNRIFFKPKADSPQTNLIVASDRRTYVFDLHYKDAKGSCTNATQLLRFSYPEVAQQKSAEQLRREAALAQAQAQRVSINTDYTWRGSATALKPTAAWDDGRFTRLQYDHAGELPLFFKVLPDGTEALLNYSLDVDDPTIVVLQEVSRNVRVRLGNDVIEVVNRGYKLPAFNRSAAGFPGMVREPGNGPLPGAIPARIQPTASVEPAVVGVSRAPTAAVEAVPVSAGQQVGVSPAANTAAAQAKSAATALAAGVDADLRTREQPPKPMTIAPQVVAERTLPADILFDFDSAMLTAVGRSAVLQIVRELAPHEGTRLRVIGHTDRFGSDAFNQQLSQRRAEAAQTLASSAAQGAHVYAQGVGSKEPVVACPGKQSKSTVACLAPNRRVVIQVLK
jgi:type IV secretion system protein VirB9